MTNSLEQFSTTLWGKDKSTSARLETTSILPPIELVTACFVYPIYQNRIVLSKTPRGWGPPGGHREPNETPEDCVRREALEEAAICLGSLTLVGRWVATKIFDSPYNQKYPQIGYQLLYLASVTNILPFEANHETTDRIITTIDKLQKLHHDYEAVKDILFYAHSKY